MNAKRRPTERPFQATGDAIRAARLAAGIKTTTELAHRAGLDRARTSGLENGTRKLTDSARIPIARVCGISPEELGAEPEAEPYLTVLDRLATIEAELARGQEIRERALRDIVRRFGDLEAALERLEHRVARLSTGRNRPS